MTGVGWEVTPFLWPLVATMAVLAGARVCERRRRKAINRALHELRRPLQALALAPADRPRRSPRSAPDPLDLALVALDDLDGAVNGSAPTMRPRQVSCRALVSGAIERWRGPASSQGRSVVLEWRAGAAMVMADPPRIAQALDNLLANALEHGGLRLRVKASLCATGVRIVVSNHPGAPASRRRGNPRRGHGLEVVRRVATAHGGRFVMRSGGGGTVAALELPLAPMPPPPALAWAARHPKLPSPVASRLAGPASRRA